jgi:multidrug efflux pump subunit AcrA (membrane-fusion protein)
MLPARRATARRALAPAAALAVVLAACAPEEAPTFGTAEVTVEAVSQLVSSPATVVARTYAATVEAAARADATAPVAAEVARLDVVDGDEVAAGDVLGVLDADVLRVALRQAEAGVTSARSALSTAETALRQTVDRTPFEYEVFDTREQEREARLSAVEEDLLRGEAVTLAPSRQLLLIERQQLLAEREAQQALERGVADARAAVTQAEAALARARADVADLTLRAPIAGTVRIAPDLVAGGGRALAVGSDVTPGQAVVTVTADESFRVELAVPEADLAPVAVGVAVSVDLDAFPGRALTGTVRRIDPAETRTAAGTTFVAEVGLDATDLPLRAGLTGTATLPALAFDARFEVELEVDEIDAVLITVGQPVTVEVDALRERPLTGTIVAVAVAPERDATGATFFRTRVRLDVPTGDAPPLRGGLTGTADVEVERIEGALTVPTTALLRRGGGEVVYAVRGGVAVEVPIRVRAFGEARAAVEPIGDATLEAGERIVTDGVELVTDGTAITGE